MSILSSVGLLVLITVLFLPGEGISTTPLIITVVVSGVVSYIGTSVIFNLRKTIEAQRIKLALEQERARILSRFVRDAAHEFKTPLTIMETSLYLAEKTSLQEKKRDHFQHMHEQIQRINTLTDSILLLTRLDSVEKTSYLSKTVKAADLFANPQSLNLDNRVQVVLEDADSLPDVRVNIGDFTLALKQIVENALRFSPAQTPVKLRVESASGWLKISISDEGAGMTPQTIEHIFDRFYRTDESHTTPGLGLGLPIAKQVIDLHDGKIEVESEPGRSTTITVSLPVSRP
jgi:signal transduction histidine kinase